MSPGELRAAAPVFPMAAQAVDAAVRALLMALPDTGEMCGDDEAGRAVRTWYEPQLASIERVLSGVSQGLGSVGAGLLATADNVEGADAASVMGLGGG